MASTVSSFSPLGKLALHIVEDAFGVFAMTVIKVIMNTENCTLQSLKAHFDSISNSDVSINSIRDAVVLLLQHNYVVVALPPLENDDVKDETNDDPLRYSGLIYSINVNEILNRMRYPRLAVMAKDQFGDLGRLIIEEFAVDGRLTSSSLKERIIPILRTVYREGNDLVIKSFGNHDAGPRLLNVSVASDEDLLFEIQDTLEKMIQSRLIISVPKLTIPRRCKLEDPKLKSLLGNLPRLGRNSALGDHQAGKRGGSNNGIGEGANGTSKKRKLSSVNDSNKSSSTVNEEEQEDLPLELRMMLQSQESKINHESAQFSAINDSTASNNPSSASFSATSSHRSHAIVAGGRGRGRGRGVHARGGGGTSAGVSTTATTTTTTSATTTTTSTATSALESLTGNTGLKVDGETLWMIGWDEFLRRERHEICIAVTKDRLESKAADIVRLILQASRGNEVSYTSCQSGALSLNDIAEQLNRMNSMSNASSSISNSHSNNNHHHHSSSSSNNSSNNNNNNSNSSTSSTSTNNAISTPMLKKLLDIMQNDALSIIGKVPGSEKDEKGPSYFVNLSSVIAYLKRKTIHRIALHRFDLYTARLVELLQRKKYLEQQQVGDLAIMPVRDARARLYRLYRDKWVDFLELSKRNDYSPSSTYYFWHLNHHHLENAVMDDMYKAILNTRIRLNYEMDQRENELKMAARDEITFGKVFDIRNRLTQTLLHVDQSLLLFSKF